MKAQLKTKGQKLHYGANIKMGDNAITSYGKKANYNKLAATYNRRLPQLLSNIVTKTEKISAYYIPPLQIHYHTQIARVNNHDKGFEIMNNCTKCRLCANVCPADNMVFDVIAKPQFQNRCQRCKACIQHCPMKAIDHKGNCGHQPRYKHPNISIKVISKFNAGRLYNP